MLSYPPSRLLGFKCYIYEWIDDLQFMKHPKHLVDSWRDYDAAAREVFKQHHWKGGGEIVTIWIPPFAIAGISKSGDQEFMRNYSENWTKGLILWHVKQVEDGLSFILSPIELDIPDFGLSR
jgi:hypothetical protein